MFYNGCQVKQHISSNDIHYHHFSFPLALALAQPVGRTRTACWSHHFSFPPALAESGIQDFFPPAPARIWSEGLKQGLQLFITCPKLKQGFEGN